MTAILIVIVLLVVIGWFALRSQIKRVEARLSWAAKQDRRALEQRISDLTARIFKLERAGVSDTNATVEPAARPAFHEQRASTPERVMPAAVVSDPRRDFSESPAVPAPVRIRWSDRLRQRFGGQEWETLVGGSLLNKIGALVLVIGVALFLGYSFSHISPAGRAATAEITGVAVLLSGIFLERRQAYRLFSRSLIGAGWAVLYVSAYAMYALPATRIISNPFAGSILLLAVAGAMIGHSLQYRSQAITSVAYFAAFAALAATPSTVFAVGSLLPLGASLLYLAWRFKWHAMAMFGLLATYATCISKGSSHAPLFATESLFVAYWILFEIFDVLRSRRVDRAFSLSWIFPLNALAFLALSYHSWFINAPDQMWRMAAAAAVLFFASSIARFAFVPAPAAIGGADPFERIRAGTFEAPLIVAALSAALAIVGRVHGFWTNIGLAAEAELLYLAGVRLRSSFLRALGMLGFAASLLSVASTASRRPDQVSVLGWSVRSWTPSIFVHCLLFYLNRGLRKNFVFSFAASGLAALILASQASEAAAPAALILFGFALFALGMRKLLREFRIEGWLVAFAGALLEMAHADFTPHPASSTWVGCVACAVACWLFTAAVLISQRAIVRTELARVRDGFATIGSVFALLTLWMLVPGELTPLPWTGLALLLIGAATQFRVPSFRWIAAGVLISAYIKTIFISTGILVPLTILAALYFVSFAFRRALQRQQRSAAPIFTWLAAFLAAKLIFMHTSLLYISAGWAGLALALVAASLFTTLADFRWQSYLVTAAAFFYCGFTVFADSAAAALVPRIAGASLTIAAFFLAELLVAKHPHPLGFKELRTRIIYSAAATLLLTGLLYHEVSGGLLTIAWGIEALSCLAAGISLKDRPVRLAGLALLLACILKLFIHDLRHLETPYRILSFLALGLILLFVSWIYTRFRTQIQRLL